MDNERAQTAMPFSLGSQSQRREASENKTLVFTEVRLTMAKQVRPELFLLPALKQSISSLRKHADFEYTELPVCLQTQMVPLTSASLVSLYVLLAPVWKTATWWWWWWWCLMEKQMPSAVQTPSMAP